MPLRIFTNISSLTSQRALTNNNSQLGRSIERIASGLRIKSAADDGAGLAITEGLRADVQTLKQGSRNLNDGISLIKTAEGGLNEISGILIRLRELASQAATGTIGQTERDTLQLEFSSLSREIDRIANVTEFSGQKLIDGSLASSAANQTVLQIGTNTQSGSRINLNQEMNLTAVTTAGLGLDTSSISTVTNAVSSIDTVTAAIRQMIQIRGKVGATQNQLQRAFNTQSVAIENLTSSVSTIRDSDLAEEFAQLTRSQILVQAAASMVGQANLLPQSVLTLLG